MELVTQQLFGALSPLVGEFEPSFVEGKETMVGDNDWLESFEKQVGEQLLSLLDCLISFVSSS